jgi:hypothetical protein
MATKSAPSVRAKVPHRASTERLAQVQLVAEAKEKRQREIAAIRVDSRYNRIEVYWESEKQWYAAVATSLPGDSAGETVVLYEDGDVYSENLNSIRWRPCSDLARVPARALPCVGDVVEVDEGAWPWRAGTIVLLQDDGRRCIDYFDGAQANIDLVRTMWKYPAGGAAVRRSPHAEWLVQQGEAAVAAASCRTTKASATYAGVFRLRATNQWRAQVQAKFVREEVGVYRSEEEAARAYDNSIVRRKLRRPLNFPRKNYPPAESRAKVSSFMYRYILRESCSQFDSLPLTSLTACAEPEVHSAVALQRRAVG